MKAIKHILLAGCIAALASCYEEQPTSSSGVKRHAVKVRTDNDGLTVEQKNIEARLKADNTPGSLKHLYIISPYSGQTILYSTVKGKVTSGGKRLTPNTVSTNDGQYVNSEFGGMRVGINGSTYRTEEVLQDDGTYGSSCEYIYWFDQKGEYHQHFFTGGQIIHVSAQPLPVKSVTINVEAQ
jgi:hypothetical protein